MKDTSPMSAAPQNYHQRLLDECHQELMAAVDECISVFSTSNKDELKLDACTKLSASAHRLQGSLAESDRPAWLRTLAIDAKAASLSTHPSRFAKLMRRVLTTHSQMKPIIAPAGEIDFDFDVVFKRHRDEGTLPALFDELVDNLAAILECPEVDSKAIDSALRKIIAALRDNKSGSYYAVSQSIRLQDYVWNLTGPALKTLPGAAPFVEAYEKTKAKAEAEFQRIEAQGQAEIIRRLGELLPNLELICDAAARGVSLLPSNRVLALEAPEEVIDVPYTVENDSSPPGSA